MSRYKKIEDNHPMVTRCLVRDADKPLYERRFLTYDELKSLKLRIYRGRHAIGINEYGKLVFDARWDVFHSPESILPLNLWLYGDDGPLLPSQIQALKEKEEQARMLENLKNEDIENKNGE